MVTLRSKRAYRWGLALVVLLLVPASLALLALGTEPRVSVGPPDAAAVGRTRDVAERLRELVATEAADGAWSADEEELNAVLASAQRVVPGVYGRAQVADGVVKLEVSAGAPLMPRGLWANLSVTVAASEDGVRVASARIGRLPLPPVLALTGVRWALDAALGEGLGTAALASVAALRVEPPRVTVAFDEAGRAAFFARLRALDRGGEGRERVHVHLWWLDKAGERGGLPSHGSVLPYLRHVVARAAKEGGGRDELKAALYALTLYCGDERFGAAIGVELNARMRATNRCAGTTLEGRDDLKRHFVISAGLYAATTSGTAFGMGELKELLDSNDGGSGFSFDDMAADLAGVRFAAAFLAAPRSEWPAMLEQVRSEADVMPALDGLPRGLSAGEFRARYGDVDSPAYSTLVAEIAGRIDALPLYRDAAPSN
jgi:hypothetical protein